MCSHFGVLFQTEGALRNVTHHLMTVTLREVKQASGVDA